MGREEELVRKIQRAVPAMLYEECFVIYQERIWRKQQRSVVHVETLFPGCVFLTCKAGQKKQALLEQLKQIPVVQSCLGRGDLTLLPLMKEDGDFLMRLSGKEHMVRLSYVGKDDKGQVCQVSEPLLACRGQIERYQFKKRYAMVRHRLWGEDRAIVMGIMLKEDEDRKLLYEGEDCIQ